MALQTLRVESPTHSNVYSRKVSGKLLLGVFFLFMGSYLLVTSARLSSIDDKIMFDVARSIWSNGSFSTSEPLSERDFYTEPWFYALGKDGRAYGKYGLGESLAMLPLFAIGKASLQFIPPSYVDWFPPDFIPFKASEKISFAERAEDSIVPAFISLLNPAATAASCVLVFLLAFYWGGSIRSSFVVTGIFGFATSAFPYAKYSFHHPLVTALMLASFYGLYSWHVKGSTWRLVAAGACLGFASLVRYESVVSLAVLVPYAWWAAYRRTGDLSYVGSSEESARKRSFGQIIAVSIRIAPFVLPVFFFGLVVLWFNYVRFGSLLATGYFQEGFTADLWEGLGGLVVSPGRSVFLFSPPALLGLLCLPWLVKRRFAEGIALSSLIIIYLVLYAKWSGWEGGWAWGARYPLPLLPFLILPLVLPFQSRSLWPKALAIGLALVSLPLQLLGVVTNFNDFYMERTIVQGNDFWPTVLDWGQSQVPGHVDLLMRGIVDLWFLRLFSDGAPLALKAIIILPVGMLVVSTLFIRLGLKESRGVKIGA